MRLYLISYSRARRPTQRSDATVYLSFEPLSVEPSTSGIEPDATLLFPLNL